MPMRSFGRWRMKLLGDLLHRFQTIGALIADGEILRQHRARDIEHEHDVHPAGLHAGQRAAQLRPGQRHDERGHGEVSQQGKPASGPGTATAPEAASVAVLENVTPGVPPKRPLSKARTGSSRRKYST